MKARTLKRLHKLSVLLMVPLSSLAAPSDDGPAVHLSEFDEQYREVIPSGGDGVVLGVTAGDDQPDYLLKPALFIPATVYPGITALCIETHSIDGSYFSHGELSGADLSSHHGVLRFMPWNAKAQAPEGTAYAREILGYGPANIAVLASTGPCGSAVNRNSRTFMVVDRASRTLHDPAQQHYRIYVSPGWADAVDARYQTLTGRQLQVPCSPATGPYHPTTFSYICSLDGPFADITHVTVLPSKNGRPLPPYRFDLACAQQR